MTASIIIADWLTLPLSLEQFDALTRQIRTEFTADEEEDAVKSHVFPPHRPGGMPFISAQELSMYPFNTFARVVTRAHTKAQAGERYVEFEPTWRRLLEMIQSDLRLCDDTAFELPLNIPSAQRFDVGVYLARARHPDGSMLESKCRVESQVLASGERINSVVFESDVIQQAILAGKIHPTAVTEAVVELHTAVPRPLYAEKLARCDLVRVKVLSVPRPQGYRVRVERVYSARHGVDRDSQGSEIEFVGAGRGWGQVTLAIGDTALVFLSRLHSGRLYEASWRGHLVLEWIDGELYASCQLEKLWLFPGLPEAVRHRTRQHPKRANHSIMPFDALEAYLQELIEKTPPQKRRSGPPT